MLKKLPYPIAGLALGLVAYGNLLTELAPSLKLVLSTIAAIILMALSLKALLLPTSFKAALDHPLIAGTLMTFPMALMLLAGNSLTRQPLVAQIIWWTGLLLGLSLILWMVVRFILKFDIRQVFSSYFVVFVGIAVAAVTGNAMGYRLIGQISFWFSLLVYPFLILMISYRYLRVKNIPPPAQPAIAIYAAPASLLLAGYLSSFETKSTVLVYGLFVVAVFMTLLGLLKSLPQLGGPFYPSMSAFTFPFVISAVASKMMNGWLNASGNPQPLVNYLFWVEFIIAGVLLAYTLIRYLVFLIKPSTD